MYTLYSLAKRTALILCIILSPLSVYSIAAAAAPTQTYTLSGTVFAEKCPINPAMGMPCTLSPVPGCTVTASPDYATGDSGIYNLPNIWIRNAITDNNGKYSITIDALPNLIVSVNAAKAGVGVAMQVKVSLVNASATVNPILQNAVSTSLPAQGPATLQGTVFASMCPPATNPPMEMPCSRNSVPQCTIVVVPMVIPMIYPTPPEYLPRTTVADVNGNYSLSLPAGDYIVTAQKSGLGSAQEQETLQANQTITLDLTLAAKDTVPISPMGKAIVQGTIKEIINPPNPTMGMASVVQPVPGCTVLVCAAVMPLIYNQSGQGSSAPGAVSSVGSAAITIATKAPAVLIAQQYITMTDAGGHYSFKDIPIYGKEYSVCLMAKKGQKFGVTQANLIEGQTVIADIIIGEVAASLASDTSIVPPDIYRDYYEAAVKTLSLQNPASVMAPSHASNTPAATMRITGNRLFIKLPGSQHLTIKAFTLSGKEIVAFADNRFFGMGELVLPITARYSGPMLIKVRGENVSYIVKLTRIK